MQDLTKRTCEPCLKGTLPLQAPEIAKLLPSIDSEWKAVDNHHLEREFHFVNFKQALDFTVAIGSIAEQEGHHPDVLLSWGKVRVTLFTHKIKGLSLNDFIVAAKIDLLPYNDVK